MIIVLSVIAIIMFVVGVLIACNTDTDLIGLGAGIGTIGALAFLICLVTIIVLGANVSKLKTVDARIEMYQEENTKIEEQIAMTVKQYQQYETDIFAEVAPDSSITLVALYPELKADTLVQEQIKVYTENNAKIKELKEEKILGSVTRWWLYFGGKE